MVITEIHIVLIAGLAFLAVAALVLTAPTVRAGTNRLKLVMNTLGVLVSVTMGIVGVGLLVWGFYTEEKGLIYFSFLPLVFAVWAWDSVTRRHRTWWGILGGNDSRERSESFWRETTALWRGRDPDEAEPTQSRRTRGTPPGDARTFSFSFNLGGQDRGLGSLLRTGAHRLSSDTVSAFPNVLQFAVVLDRYGGDRSHVDAFRQEITIRRHDGGTLDLRATSDLPFLAITVGPAAADGTYSLIVGLRSEKLPEGAFGGTISIETGDPEQPRLFVPVVGEITTQAG